MHFQLFHATNCEQVGTPKDSSEAERVEWLAEDEVVRLASEGLVADGPSLTAISYYLGPHRLAGGRSG
jgi:hypothetical protein